MSQVVCISLALVAVLCLLSGQTMAQTAPLSCADAPSMNFNTTQLSGVWFEVARNPAFSSSMNCVKVQLAMLSDNTTMNVTTTYSNMPSQLYLNQTYSANVTLDPANISTSGYNVSYTLSGSQSAPITYKVLATDYTSYAFLCGFTNATDNSTAFGVVMTRQREPTMTVLNNFEAMAAANFSNFLNGSMSTITQTAACYTHNSAATTVPFMAAIFAAIYAVLKFIN